jgi:hypothetical protein
MGKKQYLDWTSRSISSSGSERVSLLTSKDVIWFSLYFFYATGYFLNHLRFYDCYMYVLLRFLLPLLLATCMGKFSSFLSLFSSRKKHKNFGSFLKSFNLAWFSSYFFIFNYSSSFSFFWGFWNACNLKCYSSVSSWLLFLLGLETFSFIEEGGVGSDSDNDHDHGFFDNLVFVWIPKFFPLIIHVGYEKG